MNLKNRTTLTGKGEFGERNITIHAVIDETDAHTLCFDLHARDQWRCHSPWAISAGGGQGKRLQRFRILKQPTCCLFQLAFKKIKKWSVLPASTATLATHRGNREIKFSRTYWEARRAFIPEVFLDLIKKEGGGVGVGGGKESQHNSNPAFKQTFCCTPSTQIYHTFHDLAQNASRKPSLSTMPSVEGEERRGQERIQTRCHLVPKYLIFTM